MAENIDELEFIDKKNGIKITAKAPIFMEDMAELLSIFAIACGFMPETVKEYINPEGISNEIYDACRAIRKEYEMRDHPIEEEDDEAR